VLWWPELNESLVTPALPGDLAGSPGREKRLFFNEGTSQKQDSINAAITGRLSTSSLGLNTLVNNSLAPTPNGCLMEDKTDGNAQAEPWDTMFGACMVGRCLWPALTTHMACQ